MIAQLLLAFIRAYQRLVSPVLVGLMGPACRFEPSCSRYAAACISTHGAGKGSLLSIVRLCKCHPFHPGGVDLPPPAPPAPPTLAPEAAPERSPNGS